MNQPRPVPQSCACAHRTAFRGLGLDTPPARRPGWHTASCARPADGSKCRPPPGLLRASRTGRPRPVRTTGHEGPCRCRLAFALTPLPNEVRHAAVATFIACRFELAVQRTRRATLVLGPMPIGLERLLENLVEGRQFARLLTSSVLGLTFQWRLKPLGYRVARQPRQSAMLSAVC